MVCRWEAGHRPPAEAVGALDAQLDAGGSLLSLALRIAMADTDRLRKGRIKTDISASDKDDEMERRAAMQLLAAVGAGLAIPADALEEIRGGIDLAIGSRMGYATDDWGDIAHEYALSVRTLPPAQLIADLAMDLVGVRSALSTSSATDHADLLGISAQLAAFFAMALYDMDKVAAARRWWVTARRAADESGHTELRVWVRAREAAQAHYAGRPCQSPLRLTDEAIGIANARPCAGLAEALAIRAAIFAAQGRRADAQESLNVLTDVFGQLQTEVVRDVTSAWGWPEQRLRHNEANTFIALKDVPRAREAQRQALELYPPQLRRSTTQVALVEAACRIVEGYVDEGLEYAHQTLGTLPTDQRTFIIRQMILRVYSALPERSRNLPAARGLRDLAIPT